MSTRLGTGAILEGQERQKRSGDAVRVTIDAIEIARDNSADLVALSNALSALATFDPE